MTRKYKATLTIPRDKWLDGTWVAAKEGRHDAMVCGQRMCCLAHASVAGGVSKRACSAVGLPPSLQERCIDKLESGRATDQRQAVQPGGNRQRGNRKQVSDHMSEPIQHHDTGDIQPGSLPVASVPPALSEIVSVEEEPRA